MATYTHNMALSAGGTLTGSSPTLTDANAQRIIAAFRSMYGMLPSTTAQQVWTRISDDVFDQIKTRTMNYEVEQSQAAIVSTPLT